MGGDSPSPPATHLSFLGRWLLVFFLSAAAGRGKRFGIDCLSAVFAKVHRCRWGGGIRGLKFQ